MEGARVRKLHKLATNLAKHCVKQKETMAIEMSPLHPQWIRHWLWKCRLLKK